MALDLHGHRLVIGLYATRDFERVVRCLCPLAYVPWIRLALRGDVAAMSDALLKDFNALLCAAMNKRTGDAAYGTTSRLGVPQLAGLAA